MANFFRKIRHTMINENRVTRYLMYAVGEIILVVIGILIALQINTYNKELQNQKLEYTSLESLKDDLILQKEIISEQLQYENVTLSQIDSSFLYLKDSIRVDVLYELLRNLTSRHTFVANKVTYMNMGATGDVVLVQDKQLQNAVVRYYQELDYTTAVINNNNLFLVDNHFGTFVTSNDMGFRLNAEGTLDSNAQLASDKKFTLKSQLDGRRGASESIQRLCNRLMNSTETLIALIDKAIEK